MWIRFHCTREWSTRQRNLRLPKWHVLLCIPRLLTVRAHDYFCSAILSHFWLNHWTSCLLLSLLQEQRSLVPDGGDYTSLGAWGSADRNASLFSTSYLNACVLSHVELFATPWTSLSMGFSRQEYWSRLACPPPGDILDPGIKPASRMRN